MDNEKYLNQLVQELRAKQEKEKDITAAAEYASNLLKLHLPVIFDRKHFAFLTGCELSEITKMMALIDTEYYFEAQIPKKSGEMRYLQIPAMGLRIIQRWILDHILHQIRVSPYCNGFCRKRSICTNARKHLHQDCVVNMDLKDFFPSITQKQVFRIFYYYGYTDEVSYMLSRLCTCDGHLPQGAPTSPYLSNIVCLRLDKRLAGLAKKYEAVYSRYADDITFSGKYGVENIIPIAEKIIRDEEFRVNDAKTRVAYRYQHQEVTGICVNDTQMHVDRQYIKNLKMQIYYCKKYGVQSHLDHIQCKKRFYKEHMYGKAYFVNMVDNETGQYLLKQLDEINWES